MRITKYKDGSLTINTEKAIFEDDKYVQLFTPEDVDELYSFLLRYFGDGPQGI